MSTITKQNKQRAAIALEKAIRLTSVAAGNGGMWISAAGGTANVLAGEIARHYRVSFPWTLRALRKAGTRFYGSDWYAEMAYQNDSHPAYPMRDEFRFDASTIARAAIRACQ